MISYISPLENRVLVCAPLGRDGVLIAETLSKEGIQAEAVPNIYELCTAAESGAGAAVITEEALDKNGLARLSLTLQEQEPWSDLPIVILTSGGTDGAQRAWQTLQALDTVANVSLLERPLRPVTLVSAVQVSLRSRQRQYQMRSMNAELEHRISDRTAEMRRLVKEAEGFSYTISHDLRGPLRAIVSSSKILLEDYSEVLPEEGRRELLIQVRAANNMAQLIDDLLHLSRLSREEIHAKQLDITGLAHSIAHQLSLEHQDFGCVFEIDENMQSSGDPTLVRLALLNLMQNACKFGRDGCAVHIGQRPDGVFFVRDSGIGFEQRYAEKMFLPFERLVTNAEYPGTGIGLANVKRIFDRHGGKVWAQSEGLGKGATFYFTLP